MEHHPPRRSDSISPRNQLAIKVYPNRPGLSACVSSVVSNDRKREVSATPRSPIFFEPINRKVGSCPNPAAMVRHRWCAAITRNKAARGELRRGLPAGAFVYSEADGEVLFHPDEVVRGAIRAVFERFAEMGSARQVWLWFRAQGLRFPLQSNTLADLHWVAPSYSKIHQVLSNPIYAGAYVYGKTRCERYVDRHGQVRKRMRHLPMSEWTVLIRNHHSGFVEWETFEANQRRLASNTHPRPHQAGGAVREGAALLQGIARCGRCGRSLRVYYSGRHAAPGYHCTGSTLVNGRGEYCLRVGGRQIDAAVSGALLDALAPAGLEAALKAAEQLESDHDAVLTQFRGEVERKQYEAQRA